MKDGEQVTENADATLPLWYPLANATDQEIDGWLVSEVLPVAEMRQALPWLTERYQFQAWVDGLRSARAEFGRDGRLFEVFPRLASIPLPPRRLEGRRAR